MKFAEADTAGFSGAARDEDSVDVVKGWNIIGTITSPVAVTAVGDPGGIVLSSFYGFNGSYFTADTLKPGASYWVKVSADGSLVLKK